MTTRKLTPAEALEVFRDWRAVERADMTSTAFYDKWGTFDSAVSDAIAALEEALSQQQKPAAPHAMEPSCAKCGHPKSNHPFRHPFQPVMLSLGASPTAAPVPSDEEIVKQLEWARAAERHSATCTLVELLARRIGVQGVPK